MAVVSGGDRADKELKRISDQLAKGQSLEVGFFADATYPDGTSVAMVAAANEFGDPARGRPPRPFFRNMVRRNSKKWPVNYAVALHDNDFDNAKALALMGEEIEGELKQSINELVSPKLKPATVEAKGFDKPLIRTDKMIDSTTYRVRGE